MVPKIIAALKAFIGGPFALSLGITLLVLLGIAIGTLVAAQMDAAAIQKKQAQQTAAIEAAMPPPTPQRVVQAEVIEDSPELAPCSEQQDFQRNQPEEHQRALRVEIGLSRFTLAARQHFRPSEAQLIGEPKGQGGQHAQNGQAQGGGSGFQAHHSLDDPENYGPDPSARADIRIRPRLNSRFRRRGDAGAARGDYSPSQCLPGNSGRAVLTGAGRS